MGSTLSNLAENILNVFGYKTKRQVRDQQFKEFLAQYYGFNPDHLDLKDTNRKYFESGIR